MSTQACRECGGPMTLQPSPRDGDIVYMVAIFGCNRCIARRAHEKQQAEAGDALREANGLISTPAKATDGTD